MLPIQPSPTAPRQGSSSVGGSGGAAASAIGGPTRTGPSNLNLRPLPNPDEEAQLIRQRSQAQIYPQQSMATSTGVPTVSFTIPMPVPTVTSHPAPPMPEAHYPFAAGYGSQSAMAPPTAYPYYLPQNSGTLHFGPAPLKQTRRYKTTKTVTLTQGNLVLDCPVPTKLLDVLPRKNGDEFTTMRYTAVTCDPNEFKRQNYTLRPKLLNRETELFIVMTMYNVSCIFLSVGHSIMNSMWNECGLAPHTYINQSACH